MIDIQHRVEEVIVNIPEAIQECDGHMIKKHHQPHLLDIIINDMMVINNQIFGNL